MNLFLLRKILAKLKSTHLSGLDYPESKAIYEKSSQRIETYSRIIYLVLFKITPICFVAPVSIGSLFIYFANDFDNEALKLPIPMWYVCLALSVSFGQLILEKIVHNSIGSRSIQTIWLAIWLLLLWNMYQMHSFIFSTRASYRWRLASFYLHSRWLKT